VIALARGCLRSILLMASLSFTSLSWLWAFAGSASAFTEPGLTGGYADFANCPANIVGLAPLGRCLHSYTTGGMVQIGHSSVQISIPGDTFDVGTAGEEESGIAACMLLGGTACAISPPHGILNGPAQPVPGGLLGVVGNVPLTGVSAKLEWATPLPVDTAFGRAGTCGANSPLAIYNNCVFTNGRAGTAATLSVKIHLMSPFLGSNCYIGSATSPIVIALTAGVTSPPPPAQPIHGKPYESVLFGTGANILPGVTLVNNSFAVPVASGCGTSKGSLINASINHKLGLPSLPGHNMIVINATGEEIAAANVLQHGWTGE
jgi:hypothetical protein